MHRRSGRHSPKAGPVGFSGVAQESRIPAAVATSSEAHFTKFSLGQAGLLEAFQVVVTGDQVERGKPAPDIYLEAARRLGVAPQYCVALEDSEAGVVAASIAGMVTLLVPDWVPPSAVARRAASHVLPSLIEAQAFVEATLLTEQPAG